MALAWNDWQRISKTRKQHKCEVTGESIPIGSACWKFTGVYEGEFQRWYCTDEAKQFWDKLPHDPDGYECSIVGDMMREASKNAV
ncbi:hypothetical protein [Paenibacillus chitinolyticus]|uniref:hypothetical protein n=1 Tax=Paenibacillus chitinolyticus TaxID=79263 RepID=UPI003D04C4A1